MTHENTMIRVVRHYMMHDISRKHDFLYSYMWKKKFQGGANEGEIFGAQFCLILGWARDGLQIVHKLGFTKL